MSLFRILSRIKAEPWAITQEYMNTILEIANRENKDPEAVAAKMGRDLENTYDVEYRDGVAILPVTGPLFRYSNLFTRVSGASSYQMLAQDFDKALNDPSVEAILLNIDSPGGEANGVSEFADQVFAARSQKPVVAYVGGQASSAAYWIAAAAGEMVINDAAYVGSIGTVVSITDTSERDAKNGIKRHEIVSSQSPYKRVDPSSDEGQAKIRAFIDSLSDVFIAKVAQYRGVTVDTVMQDFGQGDVIVGQAAVEAGMADRVGSFEGVISEMASTGESIFGISTAAAGGQQQEDGAMPFYLTQTAPAAGDEQRNQEATAANFAKLCPEAADQLRQEGAEAKAKEIEGAGATAATSERDRVKAILSSEEADGRGELANHLAFETDMAPEAALAMLAKSAKEQPVKPEKDDPLSAAMNGVDNPDVGADSEGADDEMEAAIARSQKLGEQLGC